MSGAGEAALLTVFLLAACVWVGGLVAIAVVARAAGHTLSPVQRIDFFRALGRMYGIVGGLALVVGLGTGAGLLADRHWDATLTTTAAVAAALVAVTAVGVAQARRMTRLRRVAAQQPDDAPLARQVHHAARRAAALRAAIGLLSLALVALGATLAT